VEDKTQAESMIQIEEEVGAVVPKTLHPKPTKQGEDLEPHLFDNRGGEHVPHYQALERHIDFKTQDQKSARSIDWCT
jgi:hypothetical protein